MMVCGKPLGPCPGCGCCAVTGRCCRVNIWTKDPCCLGPSTLPGAFHAQRQCSRGQDPVLQADRRRPCRRNDLGGQGWQALGAAGAAGNGSATAPARAATASQKPGGYGGSFSFPPSMCCSPLYPLRSSTPSKPHCPLEGSLASAGHPCLALVVGGTREALLPRPGGHQRSSGHDRGERRLWLRARHQKSPRQTSRRRKAASGSAFPVATTGFPAAGRAGASRRPCRWLQAGAPGSLGGPCDHPAGTPDGGRLVARTRAAA